MKKILIMAAEPSNEATMRLREELDSIKDLLHQSRRPNDFEIVDRGASTSEKLIDLIITYKPAILHFCGHGAGPEGLAFEDAGGRRVLLDNDVLKEILDAAKADYGGVECAVLNACHSEVQARLIHERVPYVIGMSREILDTAALAFSTGFYKALFAGCSYAVSFAFARLNIRVQDVPRELLGPENRDLQPVVRAVPLLPEHLKPVLLKPEGEADPRVTRWNQAWIWFVSRRPRLYRIAAAGVLVLAALSWITYLLTGPISCDNRPENLATVALGAAVPDPNSLVYRQHPVPSDARGLPPASELDPSDAEALAPPVSLIIDNRTPYHLAILVRPNIKDDEDHRTWYPLDPLSCAHSLNPTEVPASGWLCLRFVRQGRFGPVFEDRFPYDFGWIYLDPKRAQAASYRLTIARDFFEVAEDRRDRVLTLQPQN
jgi:hypothetical protein